MRRRLCATMRRPASSIMALIAPVRLRPVASGLMMENVRSTGIRLFGQIGQLDSGEPRARQASVDSQVKANSLAGPPVAPFTLGRPTISVAPEGGTLSRLATF